MTAIMEKQTTPVDDLNDAIKALVDEGLSAGQIGRKLSLTRNQVIGKCHRNGWALHGRKPPAMARPKGHKRSEAVPEHLKPPAKPKSRPRVGVITGYPVPGNTKPYVPPPEPLLTGNEPRLADLQRDMCRWPVGDGDPIGQRFCGQRIDPGSPYCPHHRGRGRSKVQAFE